MPRAMQLLHESYDSYKSQVLKAVDIEEMRDRPELQEYWWVTDPKRKSLEEYLAGGYIIQERTAPSTPSESMNAWGKWVKTKTTYDLRKLHNYKGCKGHGTLYSPYHVECTGCHTEIRFWEWGVDYDLG